MIDFSRLFFRFRFVLILLLPFNLQGQSGVWIWINGTDSINARGVNGIQGIPSVNNHPSCVYEPCDWKDKLGNFWILNGNTGYLWKYNPITNEWTWEKGSKNHNPKYGKKGQP